MKAIKLFCIAFPIIIAIDITWITVIAAQYYKAQLGSLLAASPNLAVGVLFYVVYVIGIIALVLKPAFDARSFKKAVVLGAVLGFVAYATYDLTNLSTTANWPLMLTFVDMAWGTALTAFVSGLTYFLATKVFRV
jgi:uncharacterized membrane protein